MLRILAEGGGHGITEILTHWISEFWFWAQELHHGYRHGTMVEILSVEHARAKALEMDFHSFPIVLDDIDG